ncbi:hypothetical protein MUP05_05145 [Candidatus Bathyarchaeota archaeon]|nr:hypothetical protein [Candidatus Bathyarchaeota archaeon]
MSGPSEWEAIIGMNEIRPIIMEAYKNTRQTDSEIQEMTKRKPNPIHGCHNHFAGVAREHTYI